MTSKLKAIAYVSDLLKKLLDESQTLNSSCSVFIDSPVNIDTKKSLAISLFLIDISENKYLKNNLPPRDISGKIVFGPLAVNLQYLITIHAENSLKQQELLAEVMKIFHEKPVLFDKNSTNMQPDLSMNIDLFAEQDFVHVIWPRLFPGTNYKHSIIFEVSSVIIS